MDILISRMWKIEIQLVLCGLFISLVSGCLHRSDAHVSRAEPMLDTALLRQRIVGSFSLVEHALGARGEDLLARAEKQGTKLEFLADGTCVIHSMPFVVQMDDKSFNVLLFFNSDGGLWEIDQLNRLVLKTAPSHENPFVGEIDLCHGEVRVLFGDSDNRKSKLLTFSKVR